MIQKKCLFLKDHNKTAIIWKDQQISYRTLLDQSHYYSTLYDKDKTNRVAIFSENRPEWAYAFYSGWRSDTTAVPIDFMSTADEVAYILQDCQPEVVFCSLQTLDLLNTAKESVDYSPEVIVFESVVSQEQEAPSPAFPEVDISNTAVIIYTSGTTGTPKGVMLSFDNLLANIESVTEGVEIYTPDRNVMVMLPLHHVFPLIGSLAAPFFVGATTAFTASLATQDIMDTMQNNRIAIIIGVPRFYSLLRNGIMDKINKKAIARLLFKFAGKINSLSFSRKLFKTLHTKFGGHLLFLVAGGAKTDEAVCRDFMTLGFEMLEGFGMTEAAPMICFTRPGRVKIGSAGEAMTTLEVTSKDGEIIARGRNIMQGYFNRKEETDEVIIDGWLHTGDLGHFDDEGFVHITGRKKEIIVLSNGKNINPEEVENKILGMTDVISDIGVYMKNDSLNAAVFPDFYKLKSKDVSNLADAIRWDVIDKYNQKVSPYKRINKFIIMKEELPKTRLGKIQRHKLAELTTESSTPRKKTAEPQFEEYLVIKNYLEKQIEMEVYPEAHFEIDLGMDSLDKISFQTFLQATFGVETKDDLFIKYPTLLKLSNYVKDKKVRISVEAVKWAEIFKEKIDVKLPRSWVTYNFLKNASKIFLNLYFRLKGEGPENLPEGPYILASNHQSYFDGLFVASFLKNKQMKKTYFYAKEKHVRNPWVRFIADRHNVIIMDINKDLKLSLQKLAEVLKVGRNLIIFPEGTRSHDGNIGNFKKTFAILSRELNIPVVPVSIQGASDALPRGKKFPRPWKKIKVKFHEAIYPGDHTYESLRDEVYNSIKLELS
ncbi:MAG: AMP-binding protein [bacterium]|nr:AMP-binding protein [bacterium]